MSGYPSEAVEMTVTVIIPVTEENRAEVDGPVCDLLDSAGLTYWTSKVAHYNDGALVAEYGFKRPAALVRPRRRRASVVQS